MLVSQMRLRQLLCARFPSWFLQEQTHFTRQTTIPNKMFFRRPLPPFRFHGLICIVSEQNAHQQLLSRFEVGRSKSHICADTQTDMLAGLPASATCVQRFDDSRVLQFALRIAFCCVLHRCWSLDIHRHEFYVCYKSLLCFCLVFNS